MNRSLVVANSQARINMREQQMHGSVGCIFVSDFPRLRVFIIIMNVSDLLYSWKPVLASDSSELPLRLYVS